MGIKPKGLGLLSVLPAPGTLRNPFVSVVEPDLSLFLLLVRTSFLELRRFFAGTGLSEPEVVMSSSGTVAEVAEADMAGEGISSKSKSSKRR
jgi:hypothetical protein